MTKSELIERFAIRYPHLVTKDAEVVVQTILDVMCNSLMVGQRVEIRGFGVFHLRYRPPRDGRNPKSGRAIKVPAKYVPHFKAGKELRERAKNQSSPTPLIDLLIAAGTCQRWVVNTVHRILISGLAGNHLPGRNMRRQLVAARFMTLHFVSRSPPNREDANASA